MKNLEKLLHNAEQLKVAYSATLDELVATITTQRELIAEQKQLIRDQQLEIETANETISNIQERN